jgi:hypothetical protein
MPHRNHRSQPGDNQRLPPDNVHARSAMAFPGAALPFPLKQGTLVSSFFEAPPPSQEMRQCSSTAVDVSKAAVAAAKRRPLVHGSRCGDAHSMAIPPACFGVTTEYRVAFHKSGACHGGPLGVCVFQSEHQKAERTTRPSRANSRSKAGREGDWPPPSSPGTACKARCIQSVGLQAPAPVDGAPCFAQSRLGCHPPMLPLANRRR